MKEQLSKLGFNSTEIEIYLYVLSHGRVTPSMISEDTNIKRPTVYASLSELLRKGVVTEDNNGKTKHFMASARDLEKIMQKEKKQVSEKESIVESLLPELKKISRFANTPVPIIRHIRESDLRDFLYKQTPVWNESMKNTGEMCWWGYNSADVTNHMYIKDWIDYYWKHAPKQTEVRLFSYEHGGEMELNAKKYERRHIKYWDEEYGSTLWIMGDYIVMAVTKDNPQYLIEIKDKMMAESLRRTYRKLWSLTE